jgi:hypothetical protein
MQDLAPKNEQKLRSIAYSMDALVPGFYVWLGPFSLRLGGCVAEQEYPGVLHHASGLALVLPGYRIYTTYQGNYDPR